MQRENCIALLNLLKKEGIELGIGNISPKNLLNLPDKLVEKIIKIPNKFQLINVLYYLEGCYKKGISDEEFLLPAIEIIASCNRDFQVQYAIEVLHNIDAECEGINFKGARIVSCCSEKYQAEYCKKILCDINAIDIGIALEGAKIIANCNKPFQVEYCALLLCSDGNNDYNGQFVLKFASIFASCQEKFQVEKCYEIFLETFHLHADQDDYVYGIEQAKAIASYSQFVLEEASDINDLTVHRILLMIEEEPFDISDEINGEMVNQFIKKKYKSQDED